MALMKKDAETMTANVIEESKNGPHALAGAVIYRNYKSA
jgi:hypothetical protein